MKPHLLLAIAVVGAAPHLVAADPFTGMPGVDVPETDRDVAPFLAKWPKLAAAVHGKLFDAVFPGGRACDNPDAAYVGGPAAAVPSPDGKQLLVVGQVKLDAKLGKQLGLADPGSEVATIVEIFDGPTGTLGGVAIDHGGDACSRHETKLAWSADSRRASVISAGSPISVTLVDARTHATIADTTYAEPYAVSPTLRHVAGTKQPTELDIDDTKVWGTADGAGVKVWALAWSSDTQLTFCGSTPKEPAAQYRVSVVADGDPTVAKLGPCTAKL